MAVRTTATHDIGTPGGLPPAGARPVRSPWLSQNIITAAVGGVAGFTIGHYVGTAIANNWENVGGSGQNDIAIVLSLVIGYLGWMIGIGAFNYPLLKVIGREPVGELPEAHWSRYFKYTLDHKVVGVQYVFGVLIFLFTGGLLAMAIRTELLNPNKHFIGPDTYIAIVGEHGTIMMMMA